MSRTCITLIVAMSTAAFAQAEDGGTPLEPAADAGLMQIEIAPDAGTPIPPVVVTVPAPQLKVGFGDGVTFKHGEMKLQLRGRVQVQFNSVVPGESSTAHRSNAIYVRRARLALRGDLPWHLSFNLQLAFANLDMEADAPNVLRDFNVTWAPLRDLSVRFGQMKVPFDVQRVISSSSLQMVDRTLTTTEFNLDRDVGLVLFSDDLLGLGQRLRYAAGIFGGDGRNRIGTNVGLLYSARLRFSPLGAFDDKVEGDPDRDPALRLAFGGAIARNIATNRPRSTTGTPFRLANFNYTHATGDVNVKWNGFSLLSSIYWRQADLGVDGSGAPTAAISGNISGSTVTEYSRSGWGWFVQGGAYVTNWLELTARWGDLYPLGPTDPALTRQREFGGGFNLMFFKHDLKLQSDVLWIDNGASNGRLQLRVQAQVYF